MRTEELYHYSHPVDVEMVEMIERLQWEAFCEFAAEMEDRFLRWEQAQADIVQIDFTIHSINTQP